MLASYLSYHSVVAIIFALIFIIVKGIKKLALNIQEFISSLPQSLVKNEDISIPDDVIRKLFRLADLCKPMFSLLWDVEIIMLLKLQLKSSK